MDVRRMNNGVWVKIGTVLLFLIVVTSIILFEKNHSFTKGQSQEKKIVTPSSPQWLYTNGAWKKVNEPGLGEVMKGWLPSKDSPQYGRRAKIKTDSSFAILKQRSTGGRVKIFVDGKPVVNKKMANGGKVVNIPIYKQKTGWHQIEIAYSSYSEVDGLLISKDARVKKPKAYKKKLVVIGHSYVEGFGPDMGLNSFPTLLGDMLKVESINQGIGRTDIDVSSSPNAENSALDRVQQDVIDVKPDFILSVYGFNAVSEIQAGSLTHKQYEEDYTKFLNTIEGSLPDTTVFASGIVSILNYPDQQLKPFNQDIKNACQRVSNCTFIDLSNKWSDVNYDKYLHYDKVHPSKQGHKFLAEEYAKVILPVIKK